MATLCNRLVFAWVISACLLVVTAGCQRQDTVAAPSGEKTLDDAVKGTVEANPTNAQDENAAEPSVPMVRWVKVDDLPNPIVIYDMVFWEPDDTVSLRKLIREQRLVRGKRVLEIGTGSGLLSLCCLKAGASRVVATDINPNAVRNAIYNVMDMGYGSRFDCRQVPRRAPSAWSVIEPQEKFDVIVSNPPWENQKPTTVADFALYDPGFGLMISLMEGVKDHLNPGGRMLLAYGCVSAVRKVEELARIHDLNARIIDDRKLDDLPEVFLPGMLIEITIPVDASSDP